MRHRRSITSLSWITSQAVEGSTRLAFETGSRTTSTLVALTPCRATAVEADQLERSALQELSKGHRRTRPDRG
jgi:hypothetical protein